MSLRSTRVCALGFMMACIGLAAVNEAEAQSCNPDATPPVIDVGRSVVVFELADGYVPNRTRVADACQMTWVDACADQGFLSGVVEVAVESPAGEVMGGGPGLWQSDGILVEWHDFILNLDRSQIGPRRYTLTFTVIDPAWNWGYADCVIEVVDGLGPPVDDCNGLDDDGDGEIDEDFASEATTCGLGACAAAGLTTCVDGTVVDGCQPGMPSAEICGNGIDDDCDGAIDNGFGTGQACSAGIGGCVREGLTVCNAEGTGAVCDAVAGEPADERCGNGVDDDCDGETDEGFVTGAACSDGVGACRVDGEIACTADGTGTACTALADDPTDELCGTGIDEDCDGEVDEAGCVEAGGCDPDVAGPIVDVGRPEVTFELADGYVSNRNRIFDLCQITWFDVCCDCAYLSGIVDVQVDNPDGEVVGGGPGYWQGPGFFADWHDVIFNLDRNQIGPRIYTVTFRVLDRLSNATDVDCVFRIVDPLAAPPDVCDGVDSDDDGETDEDFVSEPVSCGVGGCVAEGLTNCVDGAVVGDCTPAAPGDERCGNGVDDDCDGETDEGFDVGDPCSAGVGTCARDGALVCTADGAGTECGAVAGAPGDERCGNGLDDDCDGETDEGFTGLGDPCVVGAGACEAEGVIVCTADGAGVECGGFAEPPSAELCGNGIDDDCDGEIDEGFPFGQACSVGVGACVRAGAFACASDGAGVVCDGTPGAPADERCGNAIDEDCDGALDNGFDLGQPCAAGVGGCVRDGVTICSPDGAGTACGASPGAPTEEVCDTGIDEDCDGETDELECTSSESCDPDLTGPRITVGNPVVTFELTDGYTQNRTRLAEACQITWDDACVNVGFLSGVIAVEVDDPDGQEVIGGGPGLFQSGGILVDWHDVILNLDANEVGPRDYTLTFTVLDLYGNASNVDCEFRIVGPAPTPDATVPDAGPDAGIVDAEPPAPDAGPVVGDLANMIVFMRGQDMNQIDGQTLRIASGGEVWIVDPDTPDSERELVAEPGCSAVQPTWGPDKSKVLYASNCGRDFTNDPTPPLDLWVVDVETLDKTQLTSDHAGHDTTSAWSRDGRYISWGSTRLSPNPDLVPGLDIWLMNADGTDARPIYRGLGQDEDPVFSIDSQTVYFWTAQPQGCTFQIWQVDVDLGADSARPVTDDTGAVICGEDHSLSSDGEWLYFIGSNGGPAWRRFARVRLSDGHVDIFNFTLEPWINPEGDRFTWVEWITSSGGNLMVSDIDGTNTRVITGSGVDFLPRWTP